MVAGLFLTYSIFALWLTVNALRGPSPPTSRLPALWLPAILTAELAPLWLMIRGGVLVWSTATEVTDRPVGRAGAFVLLLSMSGLVVLIARSRRAIRLLGRPRLAVPRYAWPFRIPESVERREDLPYADGFTLDIYLPKNRAQPVPALIYVHGGGWSSGSPRRAGRPLVHCLAAAGWGVAAINYPLSPAATFPDHLVGVKRAVAWVRSAGSSHGLDSSRPVIVGGSSGAHLAALAALTPGRPDLQPGFENDDTSLSACVGLYGIYDFVNRHRTRFDWPLIPRRVMKTTPQEDPALYRLASPIDQVHAEAPDFLLLHGTHDPLVPPAETEHFVIALAGVSRHRVAYLEILGAGHSFDALHSPRTVATAAAIDRFLRPAPVGFPLGIDRGTRRVRARVYRRRP